MRRKKNRYIRRRIKPILDPIVGRLAVMMLRLARSIDRVRIADCFGFIMRKIGPRLSRHRLGRANLAAAFPDKSMAEIDQILSEVWDNIGRVAAEFAHLDRIQFSDDKHPDSADVIYDSRALAFLDQIRQNEKPTIFFAAHIANWEIPALVPPIVGLESYTLYRPPNNQQIDDAIARLRASCMGTLVPAGLDAPFRLGSALKKGAHIGMLVDQQHRRGVDVIFFGRKCKANPLLAELARRFECSIRGVRAVRLRNRNVFRVELTEPIELRRGGNDQIDVQHAMQTITSLIEGWVRQDPGQWLWLHGRWS